MRYCNFRRIAKECGGFREEEFVGRHPENAFNVCGRKLKEPYEYNNLMNNSRETKH